MRAAAFWQLWLQPQNVGAPGNLQDWLGLLTPPCSESCCWEPGFPLDMNCLLHFVFLGLEMHATPRMKGERTINLYINTMLWSHTLLVTPRARILTSSHAENLHLALWSVIQNQPSSNSSELVLILHTSTHTLYTWSPYKCHHCISSFPAPHN